MQGYPATAPTAKERSDHFTKSMAVEIEANVCIVGTAEQGLITEAGHSRVTGCGESLPVGLWLSGSVVSIDGGVTGGVQITGGG